MKNIVVFGGRLNPTNRRTLEDGFVSALSTHGVRATASYTLFPGDLPGKDQARAVMQDAGVDGVIVASIGGAFVITGAICGLIARAEAKKVEDAAANHEAFDPSVEKTGRNAQTAQWIGYGIGAAGLAVGVILFATSPSASAETAPRNRVALAPLAGPGLGGALMRVTF